MLVCSYWWNLADAKMCSITLVFSPCCGKCQNEVAAVTVNISICSNNKYLNKYC